MKKILLLTAILLSGISLFAQQLDGTYKNEADSIAFSNEKATFRISGFGGLSSAHVGEGTYELSGDYLFIHTSDYNGNRTQFEALNGSRKDTCIIKTISLHKYSLQGILVEARNKSGKLISSKVRDNEVKLFFTPCEKITSISVSSLGYNPISFDYTPGKDFLVRVAENDIVENQTVVFKIDFTDQETLSLLMLTDDFKMSKNRDNELLKLEKRVQRSNKLDKRFKKVYVPYSRRN